MKKQHQRIQLHRETLHNLEASQIAQAVGATRAQSNCGSLCNTCVSFCSGCHGC